MTELFDTTYMMDTPEASNLQTTLKLHNAALEPQLEYNLQEAVPLHCRIDCRNRLLLST